MRTPALAAVLLAASVLGSPALAAAPRGSAAGTGTAVAARAGKPPSLFVNGYSIETSAPPAIVNGRTLVPVRAVAEALGAAVSWEPTKRAVTLTRRGHTVILAIDDAVAFVDGRPVALDTPATIIAGRTMVPLRFLSQVFGAEVTWDDSAREVRVRLVETRDGLTPEEVLRRSDAAHQAVSSYRFHGGYSVEVTAEAAGAPYDVLGASTTVTLSGAVQGEETYLRIDAWDSETGAVGPLELFRDAAGAWVRADGVWLPSEEAGQILQGNGGNNPSADLQRGIVPIFEEDAVIGGRRHYVIRFLCKGEDLLGPEAVYAGTSGAAPGDDLAAAAEEAVREMSRRLELRAYIDAETFLVSRVEVGAEARIAAGDVRGSARLRYEVRYSDFGAVIAMPRPGAGDGAPPDTGSSLGL